MLSIIMVYNRLLAFIKGNFVGVEKKKERRVIKDYIGALMVIKDFVVSTIVE